MPRYRHNRVKVQLWVSIRSFFVGFFSDTTNLFDVDDCFRNVLDDSQVASSEPSLSEEEAKRLDQRKDFGVFSGNVPYLAFFRDTTNSVFTR